MVVVCGPLGKEHSSAEHFFFTSESNQGIKFRLPNSRVKRLTLGIIVLIYYQILIINAERELRYRP